MIITEQTRCLARNVKRQRQFRGLTQNELAMIAGVGQSSITSIELNEHVNPKVFTLVGVAYALECSLTELLFIPEHQWRITTLHQRLRIIANSLSYKQKKQTAKPYPSIQKDVEQLNEQWHDLPQTMETYKPFLCINKKNKPKTNHTAQKTSTQALNQAINTQMIKKIRAFLLEKKMRSQDFTQIIGIGLSRFFAGKSPNITLQTTLKICAIIGGTMDEFVIGDPNDNDFLFSMQKTSMNDIDLWLSRAEEALGHKNTQTYLKDDHAYFSKNLIRKREHKGLSKKELAEKTGLSLHVINLLEMPTTPTKTIRLSMLIRLSNTYRCSLDNLLWDNKGILYCKRPMTLQKSIRFYRLSLGKTMSQIAKDIGTNEDTWWQWESGETPPSLHFLIELSTLFQCSIDTLVFGYIPYGINNMVTTINTFTNFRPSH